MFCEKHREVDYWACPHCLDEANAKIEDLVAEVRAHFPGATMDNSNIPPSWKRFFEIAEKEQGG